MPFGLTRRATGGGAIFHFRELTYSITGSLERLRLHTGREAAYARFHQAWISALAEVGGLPRKLLWMPAQRQNPHRNDNGDRLFCFTRRTGYDVLAEYGGGLAAPPPFRHGLAHAAAAHLPPGDPREGKLIGSAQRHLGPILLQHGSIKLDTSPLAPWEVSLADLSPGRMGEWRLAEGLGELDYPRITARLAAAFAHTLGMKLEVWQPTEQHLTLAREFGDRQFGDIGWIRTGRAPR
jgi:lipoate-protein ligase A